MQKKNIYIYILMSKKRKEEKRDWRRNITMAEDGRIWRILQRRRSKEGKEADVEKQEKTLGGINKFKPLFTLSFTSFQRFCMK